MSYRPSGAGLGASDVQVLLWKIHVSDRSRCAPYPANSTAPAFPGSFAMAARPRAGGAGDGVSLVHVPAANVQVSARSVSDFVKPPNSTTTPSAESNVIAAPKRAVGCVASVSFVQAPAENFQVSLNAAEPLAPPNNTTNWSFASYAIAA